MVSGTVRLIGDLHRRNFKKMQLLQSLQLGKKRFSSIMRFPWGIFLAL